MTRFAAVFVWLAAAVSAFSAEVVDGNGRRVVLPENPRAVAISPAAVDVVVWAGARKNLVAVSAYSYIGGDSLPVVGTSYCLDWERVILLKPDVVITSNIRDESVERRLARFGIKCVYLHKEGLANIPEDVRLAGEIFGTRPVAEAAAERFKRAVLRRRSGAKIPALFLFGSVAAGKGSYVSDLLSNFGFENCADKTESAWPVLTREFVLRENPRALFLAVASPEQRADELARLRADPVWGGIDAVRNNRVYFVEMDKIIISSPRVEASAELLQKAREDFE